LPCSAAAGEGLDALRQRLLKISRTHGISRPRPEPPV